MASAHTLEPLECKGNFYHPLLHSKFLLTQTDKNDSLLESSIKDSIFLDPSVTGSIVWKPESKTSIFEGQTKKINLSSGSINKTNSFQFSALFLKYISIQKRDWCTNCVQILTPLICLTVIFMFKIILFQELTHNRFFEFVDVPLIVNNPFYEDWYLDQKDCLIWYMFQYNEGMNQTDIDFIGNNSGLLNSTSSGLFGNFSRYQQYCNKSQSEVPFFVRSNESDPNVEIIQLFTLVNFTLSLAEDPGLDNIPDGVYIFTNASSSFINVTIEIDDLAADDLHRINGISEVEFALPIWFPNFIKKLKNFKKFMHKKFEIKSNFVKERFLEDDPGNSTISQMSVSEGFLTMIDTLTKSLLHTFSTHSIEFLISYMPVIIDEDQLLYSMINIISSAFYPFALSLGLPVYMYSIVKEREEKIIQMMLMNGLKMRFYWLNMVVCSMLIYWISAIIFWGYGYLVMKLNFFLLTRVMPMIILLFGWGVAQIGLAIFLSSFISKTRTASVLGYLLSIFLMLIASVYSIDLYDYPAKLPLYYYIIPHFSFTRITYLFCIVTNEYIPVTLNTYTSEQEVLPALLFLYGMGLIYGILGLYLNEVAKKKFGFKKKNKSNQFIGYDKILAERKFEVKNEDEECVAEREFISKIDCNNPEYPLIIKNIRKVHKDQGSTEEHVAVRCFSLSIKNGETFGLLGPNGAGKTTLISMLTGMYEPDEGNAWINGFDIKTQIHKVHLHIGVCPQFDLLWPDLTVEEHLLFYGRLKGCAGKHLNDLVATACEEVQLSDQKNKLAKFLSGGMKRRLSVAISLVGDPKVVFLDEPTTGLDPDNKRQLWDILSKLRGRRTLLLTTHSMEEADVLCSRIGIIAFGMLRCLSTQTSLKNKYGGGYRVFINFLKQNEFNNIIEGMKKSQDDKINCYTSDIAKEKLLLVLAENSIKFEINKYSGASLILKILGEVKIGKLFDIFEKMKENYLINDWMINQSSLDDVFMNIVERAEAMDLNLGIAIEGKNNQQVRHRFFARLPCALQIVVI